MKTNIESGIDLKVETRLKLTPQLKMQIKILEMPITELEEKIKEVAEENPLIEIVSQEGETEYEENYGVVDYDESVSSPEYLEKGYSNKENLSEGDEFFYSKDEDGETETYSSELYSSEIYHPMQRNPELEEKIRKEQENVPSYVLLWEKVLPQIEEVFKDERERKIAEKIFFSLDEKGFFSADLNEFIKELADEGIEVSLSEFESIRKKFMELEPEGIGAKDVKEYFIFYLSKRVSDKNVLEDMEVMLNELFEELRKSDFGEVSGEAIKSTKMHSIINNIKEKIRSLGINRITLYPLQDFYPVQEEFSGTPKPDVYVFKDMGNLYVIPAKDSFSIRIPEWVRRVQKNIRSKDEKEKFKEMLSVAQMYFHGVRKRREILIEVVKAIFTFQDSFFETGEKKPMTLQDVEKLCGYDKSTIWRAVANKYVETPYGIFKLKDFFDYGIKVKVKKGESEDDDERMISRAEVFEEIRKLIESEDPENPLSDSQIAEILREKKGIQIARRTVVKYRKKMGIPSIEERKRMKSERKKEMVS